MDGPHLEQFLTSPLSREVLWTMIQNYNKRFGTYCISADEMLRHQTAHPEIADLWKKSMEEELRRNFGSGWIQKHLLK